MKEKLCFRKYKNNSILFSILLAVCVCLCILIGDIMGYFGLVLSLLGFGGVIVYNLYAYFTYKKKAKNMTPRIGTISNWSLSGYRSHWACVVLQWEGKEYYSPHCFSSYEAEEMVGKEVSYIIINDTLLIYDILN